MDSASLPLCTTNIPFSLSNTNLSFFTKPTKLFLHGRRSQSFKVSCNASNNNTGTSEHDKNFDARIDRRNVLLGLGGLYGAANVVPLAASATPTPAPDLKCCGTAIITDGPKVPYTCCPPPPPYNLDTIPYYKLPPVTKLRTRSPAHTADEEYIANYNKAICKMKELDTKEPLNPLGFKQQANIHCAYCNGAYTIGGKELQVHGSWLFFPFHRWYLYFYERILGKLLGDPNFALPYWNWDISKGMRLPPMFDVEGSYLYDVRRNPHVRNGKVMDLGFFGDEVDTPDPDLMTNNSILMYRQMVTNAPCPLLFFGAPYVLGNNIDRPGTIENIPHVPVHIWTGTVRDTKLPDNGKESYGEDMGNFYSAGLDPVFYCHHANVDRMWTEWKALGGKRRDISDKDWLDSEFFFYDEYQIPYRVKVRDCLKITKMGYDYAPMDTPWRNFKPNKKISEGKVNTGSLLPASTVFPIAKLDKVISFSINRPATSRTQQEKNEEEEILTFNFIRYDNREYIRFDVFLNVDKNVTPTDLYTEFAGSYTSLPHVHKPDDTDHIASATFQLAITELLEDIGLEDETSIAVTLVPKKGGEGTSIGCVEINLVDC